MDRSIFSSSTLENIELSAFLLACSCYSQHVHDTLTILSRYSYDTLTILSRYSRSSRYSYDTLTILPRYSHDTLPTLPPQNAKYLFSSTSPWAHFDTSGHTSIYVWGKHFSQCLMCMVAWIVKQQLISKKQKP